MVDNNYLLHILYIAVKNKDTYILRNILAHDKNNYILCFINIIFQTEELIFEELSYNKQTTRFHLSSDAKVRRGEFLLTTAVVAQNYENLQLLIDFGIDVNNNQAIKMAFDIRDINCIKILKAAGADINNESIRVECVNSILNCKDIEFLKFCEEINFNFDFVAEESNADILEIKKETLPFYTYLIEKKIFKQSQFDILFLRYSRLIHKLILLTYSAPLENILKLLDLAMKNYNLSFDKRSQHGHYPIQIICSLKVINEELFKVIIKNTPVQVINDIALSPLITIVKNDNFKDLTEITLKLMKILISYGYDYNTPRLNEFLIRVIDNNNYKLLKFILDNNVNVKNIRLNSYNFTGCLKQKKITKIFESFNSYINLIQYASIPCGLTNKPIRIIQLLLFKGLELTSIAEMCLKFNIRLFNIFCEKKIFYNHLEQSESNRIKTIVKFPKPEFSTVSWDNGKLIFLPFYKPLENKNSLFIKLPIEILRIISSYFIGKKIIETENKKRKTQDDELSTQKNKVIKYIDDEMSFLTTSSNSEEELTSSQENLMHFIFNE